LAQQDGLNLPPVPTAAARMAQVLGDELNARLHELSSDGRAGAAFALEGAVSLPEDPQPSDRFMFVFVNGRAVEHSPIHELILNLYERCSEVLTGKTFAGPTSIRDVAAGQCWPACVLNVRCSSEHYDMGFGPGLSAVEFRDWPKALRSIQSSLWHFLAERSAAAASLEPSDLPRLPSWGLGGARAKLHGMPRAPPELRLDTGTALEAKKDGHINGEIAEKLVERGLGSDQGPGEVQPPKDGQENVPPPGGLRHAPRIHGEVQSRAQGDIETGSPPNASSDIASEGMPARPLAAAAAAKRAPSSRPSLLSRRLRFGGQPVAAPAAGGSGAHHDGAWADRCARDLAALGSAGRGGSIVKRLLTDRSTGRGSSEASRALMIGCGKDADAQFSLALHSPGERRGGAAVGRFVAHPAAFEKSPEIRLGSRSRTPPKNSRLVLARRFAEAGASRPRSSVQRR